MHRLLACALLACVAASAVAKTPLERCLANVEGPGPGECLAREAARRDLEQKRLVAELDKELTECSVSWVGYDPSGAAQQLRSAQSRWLEFVKNECSYAERTFGQGSGAGYAYVECTGKLQKERNASLRAKLEEVKSVKQMLKETPGAVICPTAR